MTFANRIWVVGLLVGLAACAAAGAPRAGRLTGVITNPNGVPQMGATVVIEPEQARFFGPVQLLTNEHGVFSVAALVPGLYTLRATLGGYLPSIRQHIRVEDQLTTVLKIQLDSTLTLLIPARRNPNQTVDADDWKWVLRTSAATRPVLRFSDDDAPPAVLTATLSTEIPEKKPLRGQVELSSGAHRPGSVSNLPDAPGTGFAYEQPVGGQSLLLMAGQFSYEREAMSGGFSTVWLPEGQIGKGSQTSIVLRESRIGDEGPTFRGGRITHQNQFAVGDRLTVRYGAEYILVSLQGNSSSVRPEIGLAYELSPTWRAQLFMADRPFDDLDGNVRMLQNAVDQLDALPTVMLRNGRTVLENGSHQELSVEHRFGKNASLVASAFRDRSSQTAVLGRGSVSSADYLQDFFSNSFAYDAGDSGSWGARVAYRQKIADGVQATVVGAWAGALEARSQDTTGSLRDDLQTRYLPSVAVSVSSHIPKTKTELTAGYKWISGAPVSRQDPYGESLYRMDPHLNFAIRQPLPNLFACRLEALLDFRNLLAEGYVPVSTSDGRVVLIPSPRSVRGGLSFQF